MIITYFSLVCILGAALAQDGYGRDNPSSQLGYNPFGQRIVGDEYDKVHGDEIPGEAGRDYPVYAEVPPTRFRCSAQRTRGYYADPQTQCQVFWICQDDGRSDAFLCPNGTIFNQRYLVCDWWYNFDCATALSFYSVNDEVAAAQDEVDRRAALRRFSQLRSSALSPYSSTGGYDYSSSSGAFSSGNGYYNPTSGYTGRPFSTFRSPLRRLGTNRRPSSSYGAPSSGRYNNAQSNKGNLNNAASYYNAPSSGRYNNAQSNKGNFNNAAPYYNTQSSGRYNNAQSNKGNLNNAAPYYNAQSSGSYNNAQSNKGNLNNAASYYNAQSSGRYNNGRSNTGNLNNADSYYNEPSTSGRFAAPSTSYGVPFTSKPLSNNQQQNNGYSGGSSSPSGTPFSGDNNSFGSGDNNQQQNDGYSGGSSSPSGTPFSGDNNSFGSDDNNQQQNNGYSGGSSSPSGTPFSGDNNSFGSDDNNQQQNNGYSEGSSSPSGTPFSGDNNSFGSADNIKSGPSQLVDSGYDSGIPATGNNFSDEVDSFDDDANPDRSYLPPSNDAAQISAPDRSYLPPSK